MNSIVIYLDGRDEVCVSYAKELEGKIYVLVYGNKKPSQGIIHRGVEPVEDVKKLGKDADVLIFRKDTPVGRKIMEHINEFKNLKLLLVN